MNRFEAMSVFAAVVEAGSLSAASRRLHMPLATVSRKLAELESHIGTRLLLRSTRKLSLTDSGAAYFAACKRIIEDIGEAERAAAGEYRTPKGELIVAAPLVFGRLHVLPLVCEFLRTYPDIDLRLQLGDRVLNFWEEHVDAAVRVGELPDSSLVAVRAGNLRRVVCASPRYLRKHGTPRKPQDLAAHQCVSFAPAGSAEQSWYFGSEGSTAPAPVHSRLVVNTAEAAVDAAVAGVGLTRLLSYQVRDAVQRGALTVVLKKFEPPAIPVSLIHAGQRPLPLKLRAFLDFARPRLAAALQAVERAV